MTRALRDIPAVRALAEREARAFYGALPPMSPQRTPRPVRRMSTTTEPGWDVVGAETTTWEDQDETWRNAIVSAHLALLTDLSRPASALALAGVLADHCFSAGIDAVGTVPFTHPAFWLGGSDDDATELRIAADGVSYRFDLDGFEGWDDGAALLATALHVLGGAS